MGGGTDKKVREGRVGLLKGNQRGGRCKGRIERDCMLKEGEKGTVGGFGLLKGDSRETGRILL